MSSSVYLWYSEHFTSVIGYFIFQNLGVKNSTKGLWVHLTGDENATMKYLVGINILEIWKHSLHKILVVFV